MDWTKLVNWNSDLVTRFATGKVSGRQLYDNAAGTSVGGEVRTLLRERGVTEARRLARKALKRRNLIAA